MQRSDCEIIDMYRGLWKIEESFRITKSELESRPVFVSRKEHIEGHFLTCFVSLLILRILEMNLKRKYSPTAMVESLRKCTCAIADRNIYFFHYYDEILKSIGETPPAETTAAGASVSEATAGQKQGLKIGFASLDRKSVV